MKLGVLFVMALASLSSVARAQAPKQTRPIVEPRSPSTAVTRSIAVSLGGMMLVAVGGSSNNAPASLIGFGGMLLGPATGYWYGTDQIGGIGLAARGTALVMMLWGIGNLDAGEDIECLDLTPAQCRDWEEAAAREHRQGEYLIYGGLALIGASSLFDFVNVYYQTEAWNDAHVTIAPTALRASDGPVPALAITGAW